MDVNLLLSIAGLILGILSLIGIRIKIQRKVSWRQIDNAFKELEPRIRDYDPDVIVGVADGRIVGAIIAANLRIPDFYVIDMPIEYDDEGRRVIQINGAVGDIKNKKVLLVDNHIYTGTNMEAAFNYLMDKDPISIKKAVFFKHVVGAAAHHIDYYAYMIDGKRKVMPWSYTKEHDNAYLVRLSTGK